MIKSHIRVHEQEQQGAKVNGPGSKGDHEEGTIAKGKLLIGRWSQESRSPNATNSRAMMRRKISGPVHYSLIDDSKELPLSVVSLIMSRGPRCEYNGMMQVGSE